MSVTKSRRLAKAVLEQIAADPAAPAHARMSAARRLMGPAKAEEEAPADRLHRLAVEILAADPGTMPAAGTYRDVPIHVDQPETRVAAVVKPEIDKVAGIDNPAQLFDIAGDVRWSPEARLYAGARYVAMFNAIDGRRNRNEFDVEGLRARTAGLNSLKWRSRWHYASLLDGHPPGVRRDVVLPELA